MRRAWPPIFGLLLGGLSLFAFSAWVSPEVVQTSNTTRTVEENRPVGTVVGAPVTDVSLVGERVHTLSGAGADRFSVDPATGQLSTAKELDHETRATYRLGVTITHDGGAVSIPVRIVVTDVEEPGVIAVGPQTLRAGSVIRARLNDPDGHNPENVIWDWSVSADRVHYEFAAAGIGGTQPGKSAEAAAFVPAAEHTGMYLKIQVRYTDRRSTRDFDKTAEWISTVPIAAAQTLPEVTVRPLVSGRSIPWDIAFAPDGTMLFTERGGKLWSRRLDGRLEEVDIGSRYIYTSRYSGLMGLAVDPDFATNRRFYTCLSAWREVQVIAWTIDAEYLRAVRVADPLVGDIPFGGFRRHVGCRIRFGPDKYLWITTGDGDLAGTAQDRNSLAGKLLRVDAQTGEGAPDNPFADPDDPTKKTPVYTYGHRNPQGLAFRPGTEQVWLVEHGPNHDDEINLIVKGGNYGWDPTPPYGENVPMTDLRAFPDAIEAKWQSGFPAIATSGAVFLGDDGWGLWSGRLAVAQLKQKYLTVFEFDEGGTLLSEVRVPDLDQVWGRLRSPVLGPDGALYVTTSNGPGKDYILQVFGPTTPRIDGPDAVSYASGGTKPVAALSAHHLSAPVSWTLGGEDAAHFVVSADGVLRFRSVPQFGAPHDADADNLYRVLVEAAGDDGGTARLAVAVTVSGEGPLVTVTAGSDITEGGDARFTVSASPAPSSPLVVGVRVSQQGDFGATTSAQTVTIPTSGSATVTVATADDDADEPDGSVTVAVEEGDGYTVSSADGSTSVVVADNDDSPPEISVSGGSDITEGGSAEFTVSAAPAPSDPLPVSVTVSGSGDYGATTGSRTLTIPTSGSATLHIETSDDSADEPDGSVSVTVDTGDGYTVSSSDGSASVGVADDDDPPPATPVVRISGASSGEEGEDVTFTLSATPAPTAPLSVNVTVSQDGEFGVSTGTQAVTITTSGSATLRLSTTDDDTDESHGLVLLSLNAGSGYGVGKPALESALVFDNDDPPPARPEISISAGGAVAEGGDAQFTVTATPAPAAPLSVNLTVSQDGDFGATTGSRAVSIPTSGSASVTVGTTDDSNDESDGSVSVSVAAGNGYTVSSSQVSASVPVLDNDDPPKPEVSVTAGSEITEGDDATFTLTASPVPTTPLSVSVSVSQTGDFGVTSGSRQVTIPASGSATLTIGTTDDTTDEPKGSVSVAANTGNGYTVSSSQGSATVPVSDNDDPPKPEVSVTAGSEITEGANASFTVTATPAPVAPLSVNVTVSQVGDFGATTGSRTVTIPSSGSVTLSIRTTDDSADEADGSVSVAVNASDGHTVSPTWGSASVAVSDNDDAPPLDSPEVLLTGDASIGEGEYPNFLEFHVELSRASGEDVTVRYEVRPGTAEPHLDYSGGYGQVVFYAGRTQASLIVRVRDDARRECDETLTVVLTEVVGGAVIGNAKTATGTITDDDRTDVRTC